MQQISAVLVIIPKYKTRPTERAPIITAKVIPVITARMMTIKRILVALKYKENNNKYYRLY